MSSEKTPYYGEEYWLVGVKDKCIFCDRDGTIHLALDDWVNIHAHEATEKLAEWHFCSEHGEKIKTDLGSFFADLMGKNIVRY